MIWCAHCKEVIPHAAGYAVVDVVEEPGTVKPFRATISEPNAAKSRWGKWSLFTCAGDSLEVITNAVERWANEHGRDLHFHYYRATMAELTPLCAREP